MLIENNFNGIEKKYPWDKSKSDRENTYETFILTKDDTHLDLGFVEKELKNVLSKPFDQQYRTIDWEKSISFTVFNTLQRTETIKTNPNAFMGLIQAVADCGDFTFYSNVFFYKFINAANTNICDDSQMMICDDVPNYNCNIDPENIKCNPSDGYKLIKFDNGKDYFENNGPLQIEKKSRSNRV